LSLSAQQGKPSAYGKTVIVRTTYGPVTNEVVEDLGHVKSFWSQLGQLIEQIEAETD
jgi:hypothetical protein